MQQQFPAAFPRGKAGHTRTVRSAYDSAEGLLLRDLQRIQDGGDTGIGQARMAELVRAVAPRHGDPLYATLRDLDFKGRVAATIRDLEGILAVRQRMAAMPTL